MYGFFATGKNAVITELGQVVVTRRFTNGTEYWFEDSMYWKPKHEALPGLPGQTDSHSSEVLFVMGELPPISKQSINRV